MTQSPNDRDHVTDEIAQQLFTRAATIDQEGMQIAQLRAAAIEAGISGAAFDKKPSDCARRCPGLLFDSLAASRAGQSTLTSTIEDSSGR
jgi:hypothetical protein